jgi:tRNA(Ile)-lysidine synthase
LSDLAKLVEQSLCELALWDGSRFLVAFSGGLDSTALLLSLKELQRPLRAIHIDHQLQAASRAWSEHCQALCHTHGIELKSVTVDVPANTGDGLEAAARQARYGAFEQALHHDEILVTAHHADDQLETLLLRLARGTGAAGMAGIPALAEFGRGRLARPLLNVRREALRRFVESLDVAWISDPANDDPGFDRSYLRAQVVPALRKRWPAIDVTAARLARLMADANGLLEDVAATDIGEYTPDQPLPLAVLEPLGGARCRNLLRFWLKRCGCEAPSAAQLDSLLGLLTARSDGSPCLRWGNHEVRIYRAKLYVLQALRVGPALEGWLTPSQAWQSDLGRLELVPASVGGWSRERAEAGFRVAGRLGGERFRPGPGRPSKTLKNWLQEEGVVPWMRESIPLLYCGDELVAIGDLWQGADGDVRPGEGWRVSWRNRPGLF